MRNLLALTIIIQVFILLAAAQVCAEGPYILSADPVNISIPADGRSYTQIVLNAMDSSGQPAPDGMEIRLTTTAGTITPVACIGGGRATAILTSATMPQVAMVTASMDGASTTVQVEFTSGDAGAASSPKVIRMKGGSLAYSVERDMVLASDNVSLEYRELKIKASNVQVSETLGVIRAQGKVSIRQGKESVEAEAFTCDLRTDRCSALLPGDVPMIGSFQADDIHSMRKLPRPVSATSDFDPLNAGDGTRTWIISRKLAIFPRDQVQFFRASIYVGDTRILKVPYYCYSYENREAILQQVRYTSNEGLMVDMPFYYQMRDSGSGALKLRYAQRGDESGGYFRPGKGLTLALEQTYTAGDRSEGRLFLDGLNSSSRCVEFTHHQDFGSLDQNGRADFSARYQPYSKYAKGIYNASLNASGGFGKYDYTVSGYMGGSQIKLWDYTDPDNVDYSDHSNGSIRASIRPRLPFTLGKGMSLTPSYSLGYGRPQFTSSSQASPELYNSAGLSFRFTPAKRNRSLSLSFDGASSATMTASGGTGMDLRLGTSLRSVWRGCSTSLSYTFNWQAGSVNSMYYPSKHNLNASVFLGGRGKLSCQAFAGYGLDTGRLNLSSSAILRLDQSWSIKSDFTFYRYRYRFNNWTINSDTSYFRAGIFRPLGVYEVGVVWSPDGQEFGTKKGNRLWLEVGNSWF